MKFGPEAVVEASRRFHQHQDRLGDSDGVVVVQRELATAGFVVVLPPGDHLIGVARRERVHQHVAEKPFARRAARGGVDVDAQT